MSGFWSKLIPSWRTAVMNGSGERDGWATRSSAQPLRFQWRRCWGLSYFCGRKMWLCTVAQGTVGVGLGVSRANRLEAERHPEEISEQRWWCRAVKPWSRVLYVDCILSQAARWESLQSCANIWWGWFCACHELRQPNCSATLSCCFGVEKLLSAKNCKIGNRVLKESSKRWAVHTLNHGL